MFDPGLMDMILRLRGRGVSDNNILKAFEITPRKLFVGEQHYMEAYEEKLLPIDCGQTLSEPLTIARMSQALDVDPDHKILEIGTGSGYHAAILSRLCKRVYSIERYKQLTEQCEALFRKLEIPNIVVRHGDGRHGWKGQAPFDRVLVTAGLKSVPAKLLDQLAPKGRLVAVVNDELMRFDKARTKVSETAIFKLTIPMIEAGKSKAL
ncbi:MAG: protein-L-isoaspartate(D-aspartate) O-methyltransferase [Hellea sp.]|nr:protein-L-isoaspartate(D-aspartate) O-methyltransferase [Hellea sp.]